MVGLSVGLSLVMVRRCRLLCANVRGLMKNLKDLAVAANDADVVLLSETLVGSRRHDAELQMMEFRRPVHLRRRDIVCGRGSACYIRKGFTGFRQSDLECGCPSCR